MIKYKKVVVSSLTNNILDNIYKQLLTSKMNFIILEVNGCLNVLTKEKSVFKIDSEDAFIESTNKDIYYKTIIKNELFNINQDDLKLYREYLDEYRSLIEKNLYGDKYIFGSVAIKSGNGFITTIRGKENLNDYTYVYDVDHENRTLNVIKKKATLNAPLLDYLFKNKRVKAIVHINHEFDDNLPYLEYAFPSTVRDSIRDNTTSFNIKYHGVIYLFDKDKKLI